MALAVLLLLVAANAVTGLRTAAVTDGTMAPAVHTGDVVVLAPVDPNKVHVHDIIAYRPYGGSTVQLGIVTRMTASAGQVRSLEVRNGISPTGLEVEPDRVLGLREYSIPLAGWPFVLLQIPAENIMLAAFYSMCAVILLRRRRHKAAP